MSNPEFRVIMSQELMSSLYGPSVFRIIDQEAKE